jgi:hypothetical protein
MRTTTAGAVVTGAEIETAGGRAIEAQTGFALPIDDDRGAEMETGITVAGETTDHEIVATVLLTLGPAAEVTAAASVVRFLRIARAPEKMRYYPLRWTSESQPLLILRRSQLSPHKPQLK